MVASLVSWVKESAGVYWGNAATRRDFRSQLRGNKPIILWGVYLGIMLIVTALAYDGVSHVAASAATVQASLAQFYQTVLALLGVLIYVLAPSLTATTVVTERKRKSLDLVFSAPVTPKYYLVGKMLSSMRYVWMLLVLALPVAAVGVVMGGATWMDVLAAYMMLAGMALVATAFGLLMSVMAPTVVSAIAWTYVVLLFYLWITGAAAALFSFAPSMRAGGGQLEANWMVGISPFTVSTAAPTYTSLWGIEIPNWIIAVLYSLFAAKILVLGAASAMSGYGSSETKSLRIHVAVALAAAAAAVVTGIGPTVLASPGLHDSLARIIGAVAVLVSFAVPMVTCHAFDADRRYWHDGWFSVRRLLLGTPSGGLPFLLLLGFAAPVGCAVVAWLSGFGGKGLALWQSAFWSAAYLFLWWSVARLTSACAKTIKVARMLAVLAMVLVVALPFPALMIMSSMSEASSRGWDESMISLHILFPLFAENDPAAKMLSYGAATFVIGLAVAVWAAIAQRAADRRLEAIGHE